MPNAIGNVGGLTKIVDVTPTVEAGAYASGDVMGGKMTLSNAVTMDGGTGILQSIMVCSKADLTVDLDVIIFSDDPTGTTFTENAAVAIATADAAKVLGVIPIATRKDLGTPVVAYALGIALPVAAGSTSRSLYACCVARGAHTPGTTTDITFRFGILQDG